MARVSGVYEASVDRTDSDGTRWVLIPQVFGTVSVPLDGRCIGELPSIGARGYVSFIGGDTSWPVWIGTVV